MVAVQIGWVIVGLSNVLFVMAATRFGLLTIGVGTFTVSMLAGPITSDFSAWYAGYSVLALGVIAVFAILGFYMSQGGRPLFNRGD